MELPTERDNATHRRPTLPASPLVGSSAAPAISYPDEDGKKAREECTSRVGRSYWKVVAWSPGRRKVKRRQMRNLNFKYVHKVINCSGWPAASNIIFLIILPYIRFECGRSLGVNDGPLVLARLCNQRLVQGRGGAPGDSFGCPVSAFWYGIFLSEFEPL